MITTYYRIIFKVSTVFNSIKIFIYHYNKKIYTQVQLKNYIRDNRYVLLEI